MTDFETCRDEERDLGILARALGEGVTGHLVDSAAMDRAEYLFGVAVRAIRDAQPSAPGRWTGEAAIALAVNLAVYTVRDAVWGDRRVEREALESLALTVRATVDSHIRALGFEPRRRGGAR